MNEVNTKSVTRETVGQRLLEEAMRAVPDNYIPTPLLVSFWRRREVHSDSEVV